MRGGCLLERGAPAVEAEGGVEGAQGEDDEEGDEDEEDIIDEEGPDEDDEGDEDEEGEMIWEVRVRPSKATKPELMKPSGHRSRGLARSSYSGR